MSDNELSLLEEEIQLLQNPAVAYALAQAAGYESMDHIPADQLQQVLSSLVAMVGVDDVHSISSEQRYEALKQLVSILVPDAVLDASHLPAPAAGHPVIQVPCFMCGKFIPENQIDEHIDVCLESKAQEREAEEAAAGPKWKCLFCTWMNVALLDRCERCAARKCNDLLTSNS